MDTFKKPLPGDFGLSRIGGRAGFWITIGQAILGDGSRYSHAFVVLDDSTVMQAMPDGAEIVPLSRYYGKAVFSNMPLTDEQRTAIVSNARSFLGVKYGFSDYLALALVQLGFEAKRLRNYISSNQRMICSQLVDEAYKRAGVHLFNDGRLPMDVTPGDLSNMLLERDWIKYG